jgi:NAD(P)-dependent dehydrogenase (short-subunit alcohol dehydrogenase family)
MKRAFDPSACVVAVTGATAGIGLGIARVLAREGAAVIGNGRRASLGADLEASLRAEGRQFTYVEGDMTSSADARALVARCVERHGRLDVLVNNVGTVGPEPMRPLEAIDDDWWRLLVDTNLTSMFNGCRAAYAALCGTGGAIVNVGSGAGESVGGDLLAYRAAKAGAMHFSRCLSKAVDPDGITVHTLVMHAVETDGGERVMEHRTRAMTADAASAVRSARERVAVQPDDVGAGVAALLRDPTLTSGPGFVVG